MNFVPRSAGNYRFTDGMPGAKPQRLHVDVVNGVLCAFFRDADKPKAWELVPVEDMAGTWSPAA
jgi:hypothetical protein